MPITKWTDEFSIGVDEIDRDHKRLLELLNDLHDAVEAGASRAILGNALDGVMLYVNYHFAHEEGLLLRMSYPGYEKHRQQHQSLMVTVKEVHESFQSQASDALPRQVPEFLTNWLFEHVLRADRAFSLYIEENSGAPVQQACPANSQ